MKRFILLAALLVAALAVFPAAAQDVEPGTAPPIIEGNTSGSINIGSLNPLRCLATDCSQITNLMFMDLIGVNPETAFFEPGAPGGLAANWEISEDGRVYTITLRDDVFWTDGTPITADDVVFTLEAILSDEIEAASFSASLIGTVEGVEKIDDATVAVTFANASCTSLADIAVPIVPASAFESFADMVDNEFDTNPSISSGVFQFGELAAGERIVLLANQDYADAEDGVATQGYLYPDVPSQPVEVERFLAGELDILGVPTENRQEIRDRADEFQIYEYPANSWSIVALNLADPENPMSAMDEDGNLVEQPPHPIFGDRDVRRALQHAIDVPAIIDGALFGEANIMASAELPTSWALNPDLPPVPYDPEMAAQMLEAAGWVMGDDGVRVANEDAMFVEPGTRLSFELLTNEESEARGRVAAVIQDQLREVGVEVELLILDFNTAIDIMAQQTYDAYLLGWSNGFPVDPDLSWLFSAEADEVGFGFNDVSYINEELLALMEEARTLPGCDQQARAEIYYQVQEILQNDQPYLWLYSAQDMVAAQPNLQGFDPYPNVIRWNIDNWVKSED